MRVLKSLETLSVKKLNADGFGCDWFTFKVGDSVPDDCVEMVELKGGILETIKEEVSEVPKRGKGRPRKEKVAEEVKDVLPDVPEIVKG